MQRRWTELEDSAVEAAENCEPGMKGLIYALLCLAKAIQQHG